MIEGPITTVVVRHEVIGFHHWPGAKGQRAYLSSRHRHKFFIEVELEVFHDDREVEFHDLLDNVRDYFAGIGEEWGSSSCETAAYGVAANVRDHLAHLGVPTGMVEAIPRERTMTVSVFEDNECGARVHWQRKDNSVPDL